MAKINPGQVKHSGFGHFAKTQGIWFAQVVNSLILQVKDISIFAANIYILLKMDKSATSILCLIVTNHVNWHRENLRSDRENT